MAQLGTISRHERSKRTRGIPLDSLLLAALSRQLHTNYYAKLLCLYPRNTRRVPTTCSRSSQDVTATMARRFALGVLASLYLAAPCFAQHPMNWEPCDGGLTQFVPSSVVLTPDPPVIGSPATFTISGTTDAAINGGSIEMVVSFSGLPIYSSSSDLCSKTACPVPAGPITITLVEALPPIAPPGDYGLQVIARGMDGSELACVNVEFSLVMPEGAIGSSGSGSSSSSRGSGSRKAMRAVW